MITDEHLYDISRPFGELTDEERGALMRAYWAGKPIEVRDGVNDFVVKGYLQWRRGNIYRLARPAPVMPTMDWTPIRPEWRYCAADMNGEVFIYAHTPRTGYSRWLLSDGKLHRIDELLTTYNRGTVPWRDSLIIRPEGV